MTWNHSTRSLPAVIAALWLLVATPLSAATDLDQARALDRLPTADAEPRIHALLLDWLEEDPAPGARAWVRAKLNWAPVHLRALEDGRGPLRVPAYPIASTAAAVLERWNLALQAKALVTEPQPDLGAVPAVAVTAWLRQSSGPQRAAAIDQLLADPGQHAEAVLIELARLSDDPRALQAVAAHGSSGAALRLLRQARPGDVVIDTALNNPDLRAGTWALVAEQLAGERPDWRARLLAAATDEAAAAVALRALPDQASILRAWLQGDDSRHQRAALIAAAGLPSATRSTLIDTLRANPDADARLLAEVAQW